MLGLSMAALALAMTTSQAQEASAGPQTEPAQAYDHSATQTITFRDSATPGATLHVAPEQGPPEQAPPSPSLVAPPEPPLPAGLGAQTPAPEAPTIAAAMKQALDAMAKEPARSIAARREREAVNAFYAERAYAPLWFGKDVWTDAARSALARLEHADEDGLALKPGALPALNVNTDTERAASDLALSLAVVSYGRQASGARIDPQTIDKLITEKPEVAEPARILATVAAAPDAGAALRSFNPVQSGYLALREKLAEVRREKSKAPDIRVASADADFPRGNGPPASGQLTTRTVSALSGGDPARLEAELIANMERWRWRARGEAAERIEVNIPDYSVRVFRDNAEFYKARVIVGKTTNQTPVFSNRMQFIEVNPYWNVPDSIIRKEMLPKLAEDPTYLQKLGYEVSKAPNGRMIVRQPPGERNALGRIKFMFPNQHSVYLHDTPTRALFANATRAYSHGCVRLDQPFKFAEVVLGKESGWTEERARALIGGKNQTIHLPRAIDIHIGYYTAFVDETGKLQLRDDIYGYSARVRAALGLNG
jgi:murein L,D-transpeptidase YcbB/YkuD